MLRAGTAAATITPQTPVVHAGLRQPHGEGHGYARPAGGPRHRPRRRHHVGGHRLGRSPGAGRGIRGPDSRRRRAGQPHPSRQRHGRVLAHPRRTRDTDRRRGARRPGVSRLAGAQAGRCGGRSRRVDGACNRRRRGGPGRLQRQQAAAQAGRLGGRRQPFGRSRPQGPRAASRPGRRAGRPGDAGRQRDAPGRPGRGAVLVRLPLHRPDVGELPLQRRLPRSRPTLHRVGIRPERHYRRLPCRGASATRGRICWARTADSGARRTTS